MAQQCLKFNKKLWQKDWKARNRSRVKLHNKKYYQAHKEECYKRNQQWLKTHPDRAKEYHRQYMRKYLAILKNRLSRCVGNAMAKCLRGHKNHRSWQSLVGYTVEELKKHLERQFVGGMSWMNYGKWHIDHIRPIASFDFSTPEDADFKICWSLENLQPLWAKDNISKGTRVRDEL